MSAMLFGLVRKTAKPSFVIVGKCWRFLTEDTKIVFMASCLIFGLLCVVL